jgi:ATP-binding cassette subfamily B protein
MWLADNDSAHGRHIPSDESEMNYAMKSKRKNISSVLSYLQGYSGYMVLAFALLICELMLSFMTPLVMSVTIDSVLGTKPLNSPWYFTWILNLCGGIDYIRVNIWIMALLIVVMAALGGFFNVARPCLTSAAAYQIGEDLRNRYYAHVQRLPFSYHATTQTGDLIQRATSDIDTVQGFYSGVLLEFLRTIFLVLVGLVLMSGMNIPLTIISIALAPLTVYISMWFVKKIDVIAEQFEEKESRVYSVIQENLTGARVVRAFGREKFENEKMHEANEALRADHIHFNVKLAHLWFALDILSGAQLALVTVSGVIFTVKGQISLGQYTAFMSYVILFLSPIQNFGKSLASLSRTGIAAGRLSEVMNEAEEDPTADGCTPSLSGDIVFRDVSFSYGQQEVLKHLSMTIPGGKTVAILGGTGSGKTTLIQLLQRLHEPQDGSITIGGVDISTVRKSYLRDRVGLVMQEPYLYSKTVAENIAIKQETPNRADVEQAAKIACVHEDICQFSDGYDTVIGERGVTLSGGQKQRTAIARAIISDSDILIFDDALSAVDTKTDSSIRQALKQRREGVTTIIISHRISTLMEADKIFVLSGGTVAEEGTHQELLDMGGIYRRVYDIQAAKEV